MRLFLLLFPLALFHSYSCAQIPDQLIAEGDIPLPYRSTSIEKETNYDDFEKQEDRLLQKSQDQLIVSSSFQLDKLIKSGKVTYGNAVTDYAEEILDFLLKDEPELRDEISIFLSKSPRVNAYMTNMGGLILNLGLIAQLENEAQLASILAHEIIHYKNKHSLRYVLNNARTMRQNEKDLQEESLRYSRRQELEADKEGFQKYFLNTAYDPRQAIRLLDIFLYGYLPFDEIEFDLNFLYKGPLDFLDPLQAESIPPISAIEDFNDSLSSHPNIKKRRERMQEIVKDADPEAKKQFIISEEQFHTVQQKARRELLRQYLINLDYPRAIYASYLMSKKYPADSSFYHWATGYALYASSTYKNDLQLDAILNDYNREGSPHAIEGQSYAIYHFLDQIDPESLTILAAHYNYHNTKRYPDQPEHQRVFDQCMKELVYFNELKIDDFYDYYPRDSAEIEPQPTKTKESLSKIDKIKSSKQKKEDRGELRFHAFAKILNEKNFTETFQELSAKASQNTAPPAHYQPNRRGMEIPRSDIRNPKLVIIDPQFFSFASSVSFDLDFGASEINRQKILGLLQKVAPHSPFQLEFLLFEDLKKGDDETFNDIMAIHEWFFEIMNHSNNYIYLSQNSRGKELARKLNTPYVVFPQFSTAEDGKWTLKILAGIGSLVVPYIQPYSLANAFMKKDYTFLKFMVFDLEKGELASYSEVGRKQGDSQDVLTIQIQELINSLQYDKK